MNNKPLSPKARARIMVSKGASIREASQRTGINYKTLKTIALRNNWKRECKPKVEATVEAKKPVIEWMRSLYHDSAHLVDSATGTAVCGAKVPMGAPWFPAEETKRCTRCQGHENKIKII